MKKILFLFLFSVFSSDLIIGSVSEYNMQSYDANLIHSRRQVFIKAKKRAGEATRSLYVYPVEAFIENKTLSLNFLSELSSVSVSVTNKETAEIVYKGILSMYLGTLSIDMCAEKSGNYKLELVSDDYELSGDFVLE